MSSADHTIHIALVDDDELDRMILKRPISKHITNCVFHEASNPEEAKALIADTSLDVMFIDVNLGPHDGFALGQILSENASTENLKIIFLSGHVRQQDQDRAAAITPYAVMKKPMAGQESEDFANAVAQILGVN